MTAFQKKFLLAIASIVTVSGAASANASAYRFRCQAKELGIVEITLSNPVQSTIGCSYFDVDVARYDLNHNLVEKRFQPGKDSSTNPNFHATFCSDDPSVSVHIPVTQVDWSKHANECWVNGAYVGAFLDLDVQTGQIRHLQGNGTSYDLQELNPQTTLEWVDRGGPFRVLVPFLHGQQCDTGKSFHPSVEPSCTVF